MQIINPSLTSNALAVAHIKCEFSELAWLVLLFDSKIANFNFVNRNNYATFQEIRTKTITV